MDAYTQVGERTLWFFDSSFFLLPFNTEMGIASIYMVEGMAAPSSARHIQNYWM